MKTVIISECHNWHGDKYIEFAEKGTGRLVAEVDRVNKKSHGFDGYRIFADGIYRDRRSKKDSAVKLAMTLVRAIFTEPVEFKLNVVTYRQRP